MWKVITALVTLALIILFIIANSGDPVSVPGKAGNQDGSASAMPSATVIAPAVSLAASTPSALSAGTAATASASAEPIAAPAIKMSTTRPTVVGASIP